MNDATQTLRRGFFGSLADAAGLLRLFDFLPHVHLTVKDTQGRFVAMKNALVRMRTATNEDDLIGKTDLERHPVDWGPLWQEEDRRVMEAGKQAHMTQNFRRWIRMMPAKFRQLANQFPAREM